MTFTWNIVTKNLPRHELLGKKLREKIGKLEKHLKNFPPDAVHLHIALEKNSKKEIYTAALTLRLPSNLLRSQQTAEDVIKAFDDAIKALLRELETLKSSLRGEHDWKRRARREELLELRPIVFAREPMKEGGPLRFEDLVRDLLQTHYQRLMEHARRHIHQDEFAGDIPRGALDARELIDETARQAEAKAAQKPVEMNWVVWLYHLLHEEMRLQRQILKRKALEEIATENAAVVPELAESSLHPLEEVVNQFEPEVMRMEDLVPNPTAAAPDEINAQMDVLAQLQKEVRNWPPAEREIFELYFVEGLEPEEVAVITAQSLQNVRQNIASIQKRVREQMLTEAAV